MVKLFLASLSFGSLLHRGLIHAPEARGVAPGNIKVLERGQRPGLLGELARRVPEHLLGFGHPAPVQGQLRQHIQRALGRLRPARTARSQAKAEPWLARLVPDRESQHGNPDMILANPMFRLEIGLQLFPFPESDVGIRLRQRNQTLAGDLARQLLQPGQGLGSKTKLVEPGRQLPNVEPDAATPSAAFP